MAKRRRRRERVPLPPEALALRASVIAQWKWLSFLALCILAAGAYSLWLGKDVNWDLKNYHYYNAYSFLTGRLSWDIAPGQVQSYFNPIPDLPFYFLSSALPPRVTAFLMAIPTGIAAFFLVRIVLLLFPAGRGSGSLLCVVASVAIGLTGAAGRAVVGSTMNEWPSAALLMAAIFVLVAPLARAEIPVSKGILFAGLLAGIASGLKLTDGVFVVALFVAAGSFGTMRERVYRSLLTGGALFLGWLLSYGFWGAILYREFGNPFFPLFNDLFKSPWWESQSYCMYCRFGPRSLVEALIFPLVLARKSTRVGESGFRDYRLAVLYVLSFICLVKYATLRIPHALRTETVTHDPVKLAWRFIAIFAVVAYLVWLKMFGYYRYLVPLELICGPLIVGCISYLLRGVNARVAMVVLGVIILGTTRPQSWGRGDFGRTYFQVEMPVVDPYALVLMGTPGEPMAYLIPFFRSDARFVFPSNNLLRINQGNRLQMQIAETVANHTGPLYLLTFAIHQETHDRYLLAHFGLVPDLSACATVRSAIDPRLVRLCRLSRVQ